MAARSTRSWIIAATAGLIAVLTGTGHAAPLASPSPSAEPTASTPGQAAALRARRAARDGRYAEAIEHYREALHHQPTAAFHFNIGACHHRLMVRETEASSAYEHHRAEAVNAYNRYLRAAPEAPDADSVAEMIHALGGTSSTPETPEPWSIDPVEPEQAPDPPALEDPGGDLAAPEPNTPRPAPSPSTSRSPASSDPREILTLPRWSLGVYLPLTLAAPAQLAASDELRVAPTLGLGLQGFGYLGTRRGIALGGEMTLATQTLSAQRRHRLSMATITLALEYRRPLGDHRWEVGGGGSIGLVSQSLVFDGRDRLRCAADGRTASQRAGLWTSARLYLALLLGRRRNHAITLRAGPGLNALARGTVAEQGAGGMPCAEEPPAFERFEVDDRHSLVLTFDLGYAPRF